jgi:SOS-response transcriptional repressor LexA
MNGAGRVKDILLFLHREYLMTGMSQTVGEYARFAGMAKSPHLRNMFSELVRENILTMKPETYKSTVMYVYKINYPYVSKYIPHIRAILMEIGGQEELL